MTTDIERCHLDSSVYLSIYPLDPSYNHHVAPRSPSDNSVYRSHFFHKILRTNTTHRLLLERRSKLRVRLFPIHLLPEVSNILSDQAVQGELREARTHLLPRVICVVHTSTTCSALNLRINVGSLFVSSESGGKPETAQTYQSSPAIPRSLQHRIRALDFAPS